MNDAVHEFFHRYQRLFQDGIAGRVDADALSRCYAAEFIAAVPQGVMAGKNDSQLIAVMRAGYARYRAIGTRGMAIRGIAIDAIDALHCLAHVAWRATYARQGRDDLDIDFDVHYLLRLADGKPQIFGWVSGDEQEVLRRHGIL